MKRKKLEEEEARRKAEELPPPLAPPPPSPQPSDTEVAVCHFIYNKKKVLGLYPCHSLSSSLRVRLLSGK